MNLAVITWPLLVALVVSAADMTLCCSLAIAQPSESPVRSGNSAAEGRARHREGAAAAHKGRRSGRAHTRAGAEAEPTSQIIVQFGTDVSRLQADALLASCGTALATAPSPAHPNRLTVTALSPSAAIDMATALEEHSEVAWAEVDFRQASGSKHLPSDAGFAQQWYLHNTGQGGGMTNRDVGGVRAWDLTLGTSSVVIAILDDGIDLAHTDLVANVFINAGEYGGGKDSNGIDDDGNSYIDDWRGWDFVATNNNPSPKLTNDNHGTAMAGLAVAAIDNGSEGIAGLAGRCKFLSVRIQGGGVTDTDWANAIEYAAQFADVISISSYIPPASVIYDALDYALVQGRGGKGCVICAAFGNKGVLRRYSSDAATAPEVVTVSGSSYYDKRPWFADYGPPLNLVAPAGGAGDDGVTDLSRLYTTDRSGTAGYNTAAAGNYAWLSGTSCANALAGGAAALAVSMNSSLSGLEIRRILEASCDRIDAAGQPYDERGWNQHYGAGRLNAYGALTTQLPIWDSYEPDGSAAAAVMIHDGEIQYRSLDSGADVDWASLAVTTGQADVRLTVLGTTSTWIRLYNAATNLIAEDDGGFPSYSYLTRTLANGTYFVSVESSNNTPVPHYGLHLAMLNMTDSYEDDNTSSTARVILPREMQYKTLYPTGDVDWATFALAAPTAVDIRTLGDLDGYLELALWNTNTMVAYDYHTNATTHISTQLVAGVYWIKVKDHDDYPVTSYQLLLETSAVDGYEDDSSTNAAAVIAAGQRLSHTLYPTGDTDWVRFTLTNRANVLVMTDTVNPLLSPTNGDTAITLYRDNGGLQFVDMNDDGNNWYFSALYKMGLDPGTYYVKITGFTNTVICPDYYVSLDVFEAPTAFEEITTGTNGVEMTWSGDAAFTYQIKYGGALSNIEAWAVATNIEGRIGENRWTDDGSSTLSPPSATARRFYRLVVE